MALSKKIGELSALIDDYSLYLRIADLGNIPASERAHLLRVMTLLSRTCDEVLKSADDAEMHGFAKGLSDVPGVPYSVAAYLYLTIDFQRADAPSKLWRYAGFGVFNNKAERAERDGRLIYNRRLKRVLWMLARSLCRNNKGYAELFQRVQKYYSTLRSWNAEHVLLASYRRVIKQFLLHLWVWYRLRSGLPVDKIPEDMVKCGWLPNVASYPALRARKEQKHDAVTQGEITRGHFGEHRGVDGRLQAEGEDRQRQASFKGARS